MDLGDNCPEQHAAGRTQSQKLMPGSALRHLGYSPYGYLPTLQTVLGFNGGRPDPVTGCYLLGNGRRAFKPALLRFISPDRMSPFEAGGLNAYAYCLGDPINRQDPSGESPFFGTLAKLFRRHSPKNQKLSATASVEPERPLVSYRDIPSKYKINLVERTDRVPSDYELIGFHGSKESNTQSLETGVDANHLKRDLLGKGFYLSTNYVHANKYAGTDGRIFGVYGRDVGRWREGVQFDRPGPDILVIRPPTFQNIIVRSDVKMPLRLIHPISGDSF